jgi:hypothetical protein
VVGAKKNVAAITGTKIGPSHRRFLSLIWAPFPTADRKASEPRDHLLWARTTQPQFDCDLCSFVKKLVDGGSVPPEFHGEIGEADQSHLTKRPVEGRRKRRAHCGILAFKPLRLLFPPQWEGRIISMSPR